MEFLQSLAMSKLVQQRQNLAQILQDLNMTRLKSEPSVYMTKDGTACILVHKDDRLSIRRQLSMNCSQQYKVPARQVMPPQERGISPTKVITTRSASAKTTPQQYRRKQA